MPLENKVLTDADIAAFDAQSKQKKPAPRILTDADISAFDAQSQEPKKFKNVIEYGIEGLGAASRYIDKYTMAPVRKGIDSFQKGDPLSEIPGKMADQFGKDPSTAPTGEDIFSKVLPTSVGSVPNPLSRFDYGPERVNVNPAAITGGVFEAATDPLYYIPAGKIASAGMKYGRKALGEVTEFAGKALGKTTDAVAPVAGKVIAGVHPSITEEYLKRAPQIEATSGRTLEDIKDVIDAGVAKPAMESERLAKQLSESKQRVTEMFKEQKLALSKEATPLSQAHEIMSALEAEKINLSQMSKLADEALIKSKATFKKDDLVKLIDKIGESRGTAIIGDAEELALAKLAKTRTKIVDSLPKDIQATQLRDVMQQIRKDIDFDRQAGEFNDTLNLMRKQFSSGVSNALKKSSPEYAKHMAEMHQVAESLEKMTKFFGTDTKAMSSLEALRKGTSSNSKVIDETLNNYGTVARRKDLLDKVAQAKEKSALLKRMKEGDISRELFPDHYRAQDILEKNASLAEKKAAEVSRLSQARTQTIIRNQGGNVANIEDRRALEALQKQTGIDSRQMIKDRSTLDSFGKDHTRGSRLTVLGGALGAAFGKLLGLPTTVTAAGGAALGAVADKYAAQGLKKTLQLSLGTQKQVKSLANVLKTDSQFFQKFQPILEKSAKKGMQNLLITHHVLMKTDPRYKRAIDQNQGNQQ